MFRENFSEFINTVDLNQTSIASLTGIDATLVSRYKTGKRLPAKNSIQLKKIVDGIVEHIDGLHLERLKMLCFAPDNITSEELKSHLLGWLYTEEERQLAMESRLIFGFAEKFDYLMKTFRVSNIKLANELGLDASLISRYRTGRRVPIVTNRIAEDIGAYFANLCILTGQKIKAMQITGCQCDVDEVDEVLLEKLLAAWIRSSGSGNGELRIDRLLKTLDSYQPTSEFPQEIMHLLETIPNVTKETQVFIGIKGLQRAVLQMLVSMVRDSENQTMYMFSDQSLEWLMKDKKYYKAFMSLTAMAMNKGNRICMIHQINRSVEELHEAILYWGSMHMSGQVEPYCWIRPREGGFCHTLFLVPGRYCLRADFVDGTEDEAEYVVHTNPRVLDYQKLQFKHLLAKSCKYIKVYKPADFKALTTMLLEYGLREGDTTVVLTGLPMGTLPLEVIVEMLERYSLSDLEKKEMLGYYQDNATLYQEILANENHYLTEYLTFFSPEEISAGKLAVNIPEMLGGVKIVYTQQDYQRHIRHLINMLHEYPNYKIIPLKTKQFTNLQIVVKDGNSMLVNKLAEDIIALLYEYPDMADMFAEYLKNIDTNVAAESYNKEVVAEILGSYLV